MWNLLEIGFLCTTVLFVSVGYLVNCHEKFVPVVLQRLGSCGAFGYRGKGAEFMIKLEIPKSSYKHYYVFACTFEVINLVYMTLVYLLDFEVNQHYAKLLQTLVGIASSSVSVLASTTALTLLTLQCLRRCYETFCLQVFARTSNMNFSYYLFALLHYFAVIVAIVGQAPLFCGDKNRDKIVWADSWTITVLVPGIPIFLWAWQEQYQTNVILANLRKDKKSGQVVTEEHGIPHGRLFESISSPHRYCEIILYAVILCIIPTKTFFCIFVWVACNQVTTSLQVHEWYKKTFKKYPTVRYAIFKGIL